MKLFKFVALFLCWVLLTAWVDFDGTDDYIDVGTMGTLGSDIDDYTITVSAWIKPDGTSLAAILGFEDGLVDTKFEVIYNCESGYGTAQGYIMAYVRDEGNRKTRGGVDSDLDLDDGSWHHVLFEIDGGGGDIPYIYVDGVSQVVTMDENTALTNPANFSGNMYIGAQNDGSVDNEFEGGIKEVYIFRGALTANQIQTLAKSKVAGVGIGFGDFLYGYWALDDEADGTSGDGDTFRDQSGNGNNGTGEDTGGAGMDCYGESELTY
jgi:hypothetical protein